MTRQGRYLNIILTVNAVMLSALVWMQIAGNSGSAPLGAQPAYAQSPPTGGIPNAGGQRERMISELQAIKSSIETLRKTVEGGKMKVSIANVEELKTAVKPPENQGK